MKPVLALRIDLDTRVCVRKGLPRLLKLFERADAPASFYAAMGSEPFLPSLYLRKLFSRGKYRARLPRIERPRRRKTPLSELARRALWRHDVARENKALLRRIPGEGHLAGPHSTCHEEWALNLPNLDVATEFARMSNEFSDVFGQKPDSFAAPMFRTDRRVLFALDEFGYKTAGDLSGATPFHPVLKGRRFKHVQVPVNLRCADTVPLLEDAWARGQSPQASADSVAKRMDALWERGLPAVLYGHGFLEGLAVLPALQLVVEHARERGCRFMTVNELARSYAKKFSAVKAGDLG